MARFPFKIEATDGAARQGTLTTSRGVIRTPAFMPVGTAGTVKALYTDQVKQTGADIILGNTFHLMLRPGAERVKRLGGLHAFSKWDGPMLTDSGGFQVWSLSQLRKMDADGVTFRSHIDGSEHRLTPARSIEIQADLLGADISMQLDEVIRHLKVLPEEEIYIDPSVNEKIWERGIENPPRKIRLTVIRHDEPDIPIEVKLHEEA